MQKKSILLVLSMMMGTLIGCNNNTSTPSQGSSVGPSTTPTSVSTPDTPNTSVNKVITGIEVEDYPVTSYEVGDTFNLNNATIRVSYEGGQSEVIPMTMEMLTGVDLTTSGTKTAHVNYNGFQTTFQYIVKNKQGPKVDAQIKIMVNGSEFLEDMNGTTFDVTNLPTFSFSVSEGATADFYFSKDLGNDTYENLGHTMPTTTGTYSYIVNVLENDSYNASSMFRWFKIVDATSKVTPTVTIKVNGEAKDPRTGTSVPFKTNNLPVFTYEVSEEGANVDVFYVDTTDESRLDGAPTTPGSYAIHVNIIEDDNFNGVENWYWYNLESADKITPTITMIVNGERREANTGETKPYTTVPTFDYEISDGATATTYFVNNKTEQIIDGIPSEPGAYAYHVKVEASERFNAVDKWFYFYLEAGDKITPTITIKVNGEAKEPKTGLVTPFKTNNLPSFTYDVSDGAVATAFFVNNETEENIGTAIPSVPGVYSYHVKVEANSQFNEVENYFWFYLEDDNNKQDATIVIMANGVEFTAEENGTTFYVDDLPSFTYEVPADAQVTIFFTKDNGAVNLGSEMPTTPGTYAYNVKVNADDKYNETSAFRWFRIAERDSGNALKKAF